MSINSLAGLPDQNFIALVSSNYFADSFEHHLYCYLNVLLPLGLFTGSPYSSIRTAPSSVFLVMLTSLIKPLIINPKEATINRTPTVFTSKELIT